MEPGESTLFLGKFCWTVQSHRFLLSSPKSPKSLFFAVAQTNIFRQTKMSATNVAFASMMLLSKNVAAEGNTTPLPPGYVHAPYWPHYGGYKSYVVAVTPTSPHVIFVNYPEPNCKGMAWNLTNIQNQCFDATYEGSTYTWKGFANSNKQMWFENYLSNNCSGSSVVTRCYQTLKCVNCPSSDPIDCKMPNATCS